MASCSSVCIQSSYCTYFCWCLPAQNILLLQFLEVLASVQLNYETERVFLSGSDELPKTTSENEEILVKNRLLIFLKDGWIICTACCLASRGGFVPCSANSLIHLFVPPIVYEALLTLGSTTDLLLVIISRWNLNVSLHFTVLNLSWQVCM